MTDKTKEALKLALEAICGSGDFLFNWHDCEPNNEREVQSYQATLSANEKAFNVIKEALAEESSGTEQPAQSEVWVTPKLRPLAKLAHEQLAQQCWKCGDMDVAFQMKCTVPACGMKEQPAQPQQEPVAWMQNTTAGLYVIDHCDEWHCIPLYTSPPAQRTWVGLTDEERGALWYRFDYMELMRAIEAKLKEKNT